MNETKRALLNKYLDGRCTPAELVRVKAMLDEPGVDEMLHELMKERAAQYDNVLPDEALINKAKIWEQQVVKRIEAAEKDQKKRNPVFFMNPQFLRYAAIWAGVLLISALAIWQYSQVRDVPQQLVYMEHVNKERVPVRYQLPDSSEVYLGTGGVLRYPEQFTADSREVTLTGEAFFQVRSDSRRPFLVRTRSMQTRVLGTSFKIDAHDNYPMVVSVATGKVAVSASTKEPATLTPGLRLTYDETRHTFEKGTVNIDGLQQWVAGDLVFDEQPLRLVMLELEKRYGISVSFSDKEAGYYRVSGSFEKGQDLRNIVKMLSVIGKFRYEFNNNQSLIILK